MLLLWFFYYVCGLLCVLLINTEAVSWYEVLPVNLSKYKVQTNVFTPNAVWVFSWWREGPTEIETGAHLNFHIFWQLVKTCEQKSIEKINLIWYNCRKLFRCAQLESCLLPAKKITLAAFQFMAGEDFVIAFLNY